MPLRPSAMLLALFSMASAHGQGPLPAKPLAAATASDHAPTPAPASPVPEAGTLLLIGSGLVGLALSRRRPRRRAGYPAG